MCAKRWQQSVERSTNFLCNAQAELRPLLVVWLPYEPTFHQKLAKYYLFALAVLLKQQINIAPQKALFFQCQCYEAGGLYKLMFHNRTQ